MDKEEKEHAVYNQIAWILNYQPKIGKQYVQMGGQKVKEEPVGEETEYDEVVVDSISNEHEAEVEQEELNYFQPELHLKHLLARDWFEQMRTDTVYDAKWCEAFVESLMKSKYRDGIAKDWSHRGRDKKELVKCCVVGCLKDAGVLKGSYDAIAREIYGEEDFRTYGKYLGRGKKQPYADWIEDYVKTH